MLMVYMLLIVALIAGIISYAAARQQGRTKEWWGDLLEAFCLSWLFHWFED